MNKSRILSDGPVWHVLPIDAVMKELETRAEGLSRQDAERRLDRYGPNRLPPPKRRSALERFLLQFHNVLTDLCAPGGHAGDPGVGALGGCPGNRWIGASVFVLVEGEKWLLQRLCGKRAETQPRSTAWW